MIHLFKSAVARTFTFALIGVVVVGVVLGALQLLLPFADLFRSHLQDALSDKLGLEVEVSRFRMHLSGIVPRITLEDVALLDPRGGRPQLTLKELHLDLDPTASLLELSPQVESLTLVGGHLVVKRRADGSIGVAGLEGMKQGDPEAMTFFLTNGRFFLTESDVYWIDDQSKAPLLHLSDVQIRFDNTDSSHRIGLLARLSDDPNTRIHLAAHLQGQPDDPLAWSGELYLDWQSAQFHPPLLEPRLPEGLRLSSGALRLQSWNRISGSTIVDSVSRVSVEDLTFDGSNPSPRPPAFHLDRLEAMLHWKREVSGWRLEVGDLTITRDGEEGQELDLGARFVAGRDGDWSLTAGIEAVRLDDLWRVMGVLAAGRKEIEGLGDTRFSGEVRDARLRIQQGSQSGLRWAVRGRVDGLTVTARRPLPGIRGLNGDFMADDTQGYLALDADAIELDIPWLFEDRNPLKFDHLDGPVYWVKAADGELRIESPSISLGNPDMRTQTRFRVTLPADRSAPFMDLSLEFQGVAASAIRHYLPGGVLKEKLENWLERAFVAGRIPRGALLFRGSPGDFPFRLNEGRFEVLLGLEDASIQLHPDWPPLEEIAGSVRLVNSRLEIEATSGRILDSAISAAGASIPDLFKATAVQVRGTVRGPFSDTLRLLRETPLNKRLGALAADLATEGRSRLDLDMAVPLRHKGHKGPLHLRGALSWPEPATLVIGAPKLELTGLNGAVGFTESGLLFSAVEAGLWGSPVRIFLEGRSGKEGTGQSTHLKIAGSSKIETLAEQIPTPLWELLRGKGAWTLDLSFPNQGPGGTTPPLDFVFDSNLRGLTVSLPQPLGKRGPARRRLHLEGRLTPGESTEVRGRYGDLGLHLTVGPGGRGLTRGLLAFGGGPPSRPQADGLHLTGSLASLDLPAWADWLASRGKGGQGGGTAVLRSADLKIARLVLPGLNCTNLDLKMDRKRRAWEIRLDATEFAGALSIPHGLRKEPIRLNLERLDLATLLEGETAGGSSPGKPGTGLDPRRINALDARIERLTWAENELGSLTIQSRPVPRGIELTALTLDDRPLMHITGSGHWTKQGGRQYTSIELKGVGDDLGKFMRELGYENLFFEAPVTSSLELSWPSAPDGFSAAELTGRFRTEVGEGALLEIDPGVGRVLGILNLKALNQRLSLDFSDLFERGFAFEKINGDLTIENGQATIGEFVIDGLSAEIRIDGSADLVKQQLDQVVTVTPRIGASVALASAVAGGPLVGAVVLLADQVTGGAMDKLGRYQYEVTGNWADPDFHRRGMGADDDPEQPFLSDRDAVETAPPIPDEPPRAPAEGRASDQPTRQRGAKAAQEPEENLFLDLD